MGINIHIHVAPEMAYSTHHHSFLNICTVIIPYVLTIKMISFDTHCRLTHSNCSKQKRPEIAFHTISGKTTYCNRVKNTDLTVRTRLKETNIWTDLQNCRLYFYLSIIWVILYCYIYYYK